MLMQIKFKNNIYVCKIIVSFKMLKNSIFNQIPFSLKTWMSFERKSKICQGTWLRQFQKFLESAVSSEKLVENLMDPLSDAFPSFTFRVE